MQLSVSVFYSTRFFHVLFFGFLSLAGRSTLSAVPPDFEYGGASHLSFYGAPLTEISYPTVAVTDGYPLQVDWYVGPYDPQTYTAGPIPSNTTFLRSDYVEAPEHGLEQAILLDLRGEIFYEPQSIGYIYIMSRGNPFSDSRLS
jgi:hypothetical protein